MKIVFVHHCGASGGAGNSLFYLLSELKAKHEIHVITQRGTMAQKFRTLTSEVHEIEGVPMYFTAEGFGYLRTLFTNIKSFVYYKEINKTLEIIRSIDPDLVHLNEIGMFSLARRIKTKLSIPVVMHARTVPNRKHKLIRGFFTRQCNKYIDQLICISKSVAYLYPKIERKAVVYNPLHLDQTSIDNIPTINYDSNVFQVLFLANFYRQKGVDETLNAAIQLKDKANIAFTIIGSNVKPDSYFNSAAGRVLNTLGVYPNYEDRIQKAIEKYRLKNVFRKGQVSDISKEISKCHLLIAPMHLNGTPRSVFEAGIYGIPSILALYHQIDDLVEHGVNGLVIKEKSVDELVEGIADLAADRNKLLKFGVSAKEKYSKVCGQNTHVQAIEKVYQQIQ